jgi:outer membrane protein assembly factor BamB
MRQRIPAACLAVLLLLLANPPAPALVKNLLHLQDILDSQEMIFMATVKSHDPAKPAVVFEAGEALKGTVPFGRMPVNMVGDTYGQKEKHPEQIMKRLAPDLPVVMFVNKKGKDYLAFVYSNGTWFNMTGSGENDQSIKWRFNHGEPYLRRTFKGTSEELRQTVVDGLAKKKEPPRANEKEPPGFGPEVNTEEKPKPEEKKELNLIGRDARFSAPSPPASGGEGWGEGSERPPSANVLTPHPLLLSPAGRGEAACAGPPLAVVPTFVIIGPLAILALLFPTVFGGLALLMRRWMAALSVSCTISTLYFLQMFFLNRVSDSWLGTKGGLWLCFGLISAAGAVWANWRYREAIRSGELDVFLPRQWDGIVLAGLSVIGVGIVVYALSKKYSLLDYPWLEVVASWVPIWAAAIAAPFLRPTEDECPPISLEAVFLWAMVFACTNVVALEKGRGMGGAMQMLAETGERIPRPNRDGGWTFQPNDSGIIFSQPQVIDNRVYISSQLGKGFKQYGRIYCLAADTGAKVWEFQDSDGQGMKGAYCTPTIAGGKVFVGEGFHEDVECRMFCLDAATGKKLWEFPTASHTESKPFVLNDRVYFGAGDDGIFCVNVQDGKKVWQFQGLHVDANIVIVNNRLYVGSGKGDRFNQTVLLCLNADNGKEIWRVPVDWSAFAPATVADAHVYFGIGNGNIKESDSSPKGALLCLDAASGKRIWQADAQDCVLCKPAFDLDSVYFTSRDGNCYCVNRSDGHVRWKKSLGAPIVTSPWLVSDEAEFGTVRSVYVAASDGRVACLDADNGRAFWSLALNGLANLPQALIDASPVVVTRRDGGIEKRRIFIAGAVGNDVSALSTSVPRLYCFEDEVR